MIVLHVEPDRGPAILMCTFAGLVGYPGINSLGVSFVQNALSTHDWRRDGMPHYLLKRVLLEQQTSAAARLLPRTLAFVRLRTMSSPTGPARSATSS